MPFGLREGTCMKRKMLSSPFTAVFSTVIGSFDEFSECTSLFLFVGQQRVRRNIFAIHFFSVRIVCTASLPMFSRYSVMVRWVRRGCSNRKHTRLCNVLQFFVLHCKLVQGTLNASYVFNRI